MDVLFISGRERTYTRNAVILRGLRENGVNVIECTSEAKSYPMRYAACMKEFLQRRRRDYDMILVGFFGQPLIPIIRSLTNKPILLDAFLSAYDTMCFDRKKVKPDSLGGRFFYYLDKTACERADKILLDTNTHAEYFSQTFGINKDKFQSVFVGADDVLFCPRSSASARKDTFTVFYYGSYLPLQGIDTIIQAAKKLENYSDIKFEIIGAGPEKQYIDRLSTNLNIKNISFCNWVPYTGLPSAIANADLCLGGHFSEISKAKRVIAGKTFQFIAMKKPVIVGDNPANRELFEHRKNAILVKHADSQVLADAILELKEDPALRERIASKGYTTFLECCTPEVIGKQIKEIIRAHL